jgi:hypothetical protein
MKLGLITNTCIALLAAACAVPASSDDPSSAGDSLTGITGAERAIHFESYVYVQPGASDDAVRTAVARQVKTALGALRAPKVSLNDRASRQNAVPAKWTRQPVTVVDPNDPNAPPRALEKVTFRYDDRAVVTNTLATRSAVDFTLLFDDYTQHDAPLKTDCTDDPTTETDSLWYHYEPQRASCVARIRAEQQAIGDEARQLGSAPGRIGPKEAARWFIPVTARLDAPQLPASRFSPEYDRLFGVNDDRALIVAYAFFGVDKDENDPDDYLAQEAARFHREMLRAQPNLRVTRTEPGTMLLDLWVRGQKLPNVTYDRLFGWILNEGPWPQEVGSDANAIRDLRRQALSKLTERWIYWQLPLDVKTLDGRDKRITLEIRSFYGYEDGSPDARQHAQWRYLEAFWHGDVFLYNGHSHFGHGPLEPTLYRGQNFPQRYQIMLVNSCISFNYYHQDFLDMHPGGSRNLDVVVNGLPSYVWGGGIATARFLGGLVDGTQKSYADLLDGMRLDLPWGERGYDPMRVVDGELDNTFSQARTPLTVTVLPPVY